ncbi:MAG TPA: GerMN domain-containing protein, partial [Solirubrobacterales bacterium]|nr:GerMN domain-containing protein [Solirubrobacterales bacterium]
MRARALVLPALACAAALGGCDSGGEGSDPTTTAAGGPDGSSAPLYFTAGEQLREAPGPGSSPEAIARALVAGPPANDDAGLDSEIPARTRVEGVRVSGGTATVRLSGGFTGGIPADPGRRTDDQQAAIDARLAQVTYTMTGLDGVERTRVLAGGRPLGPARSRADFAKPRGGPPRERSVRSNRASAAIRAVQKRLAELRYLPPGA